MTNAEIKELWDTFYPRVYGYYFRRVDNQTDVEDLTCVSLTKLITKIEDADMHIQNPEAYLWRLCHNTLANFYRKSSKNPVDVPLNEDWDFIDESLESSRSSWYLEKTQEIIECAKRTVPQEHFEIIKKAIMEEQTSTEIAQEIGQNPGTVRQRLSRIIKKIRKACIHLWKLHIHN